MGSTAQKLIPIASDGSSSFRTGAQNVGKWARLATGIPPQFSDTLALSDCTIIVRLPMWHVFQLLVVFAVGGSNIVYQWTENGYCVGLVGTVAALGATVILSWLLALPSALRRLFFPRVHPGTYRECNPRRHVDGVLRGTGHARYASKDLSRPRIGYDPR